MEKNTKVKLVEGLIFWGILLAVAFGLGLTFKILYIAFKFGWGIL